MEFGEVNPVFQQMLEQLQKVADDLPKTQERLQSLSGTAWSDAGMVKAVVGPRGQLVDLEIDPRVFRNPDAKELQAKILATTTAAARDVSEQAKELMYSQLPSDMPEVRSRYLPQWEDKTPDVFRSDAELYAERRSES